MKLDSIVPVATFGVVLGLVVGCANLRGGAETETPEPVPIPELSDGEVSYVIGVPDQLRITVWKHPDLSVDVPVRRDGKISVPLLDDVQAAGLTPRELKEAITRELSGSIKRPNVTVIVTSPDSQVVTVVGGVVQSGPVPILRTMGAVEAIAAAGGFTAWANKGNIRVIRMVDGERTSYRVNYHAFLSGRGDADVLLLPGDVVAVPE